VSRSALVTGAAGFVGGWLVRALRERGWAVVTLDRHPPADLVGDLLRVPLGGRSYDVVFHLAGFSNPSASFGAERAAYEANAAGTARLARDVRAGRLVLASSCQVYGNSFPRPLREGRRPAPRNPYAASKLCGEALARAARRDVVVLRPFNHTGPGQSDAYVCPRIARQVARAEAGRGPRVVRLASLRPRRDLFDVRDMVRAYLAAAERGAAGETYNVATGRPVSIARIAGTLVSMARVPLAVRGPAGEPTTLSGDPSKFRAATGWRPEIPLRRTLADLLDWERTHAL
jgi:GDP-4-dehydro-6-deoxy-D-mannose reductase